MKKRRMPGQWIGAVTELMADMTSVMALSK